MNDFVENLSSVFSIGQGIYFEFDTADGQKVWSGQTEGRPDAWTDAATAVPLTSASKLWTAFAAMRTMELKPDAFYPHKLVNEFDGWEFFRDFKVHGQEKRANLTIHHLLTHTSGIPFALSVSARDIANDQLFYPPGTAYGYTIGHRVMGWLLRDFWRRQPEANHVPMETVQDCYNWLIFRDLEVSPFTKFDDDLNIVFAGEEAGDASIQSTGEDMMKLAVVALRKGRLPSGRVLISEDNWNKWAIPNLLPDGKLSKDLVSWQTTKYFLNFSFASTDFSPDMTPELMSKMSNEFKDKIKSMIMKQNGDYGWNYFGATFNHSAEIGWCGFFSSCLQVSYTQDVAVILMQREVLHGASSKAALRAQLNDVALELQCKARNCSHNYVYSVFCETCDSGSCRDLALDDSCPSLSYQRKIPGSNLYFNASHHACYVPFCQSDNALATCRKDTGGTCHVWSCAASRGPTICSSEGKCLCPAGKCESGGACLNACEFTCPKYTGGTCFVFDCRAERNANCEAGYCMCPHGTCAAGGACHPSPAAGAKCGLPAVMAEIGSRETWRRDQWNIVCISAGLAMVLTILAMARLAGFWKRANNDVYLPIPG